LNRVLTVFDVHITATVAFEDPDACRVAIDRFNNSPYLDQVKTITVSP
jgi:hypothetical protein